MGITPVFVLFISIFIGIAAISDAKKKGQAAIKMEREAMPEPEHSAFEPLFSQEEIQAQPMQLEGEDPCHADMLPKRPVPVQPAAAAIGPEGVDQCHDYVLRKQETDPILLEEDAAEENETAQELLRGVILSEILRRPAAKPYRRQQ